MTTEAADFKVDNVKTDLNKLSAEVDVSLYATRVECEHYKMDFNISNGGMLIYGEGSFQYVLPAV